MARIDTLEHFLTDVADAIRTRKGTSAAISCDNYDDEILSIEGGVVEYPIEVTYTFANQTAGNGAGSITLSTEDSDYDGDYKLYWANANGIMENHSAINTMTLTLEAGTDTTYDKFCSANMIPKYATKVVVCAADDTTYTVLGECNISASKLFSAGNYGNHAYSFGVLADVHLPETYDAEPLNYATFETAGTDFASALLWFNNRENVTETHIAGDITCTSTQSECETYKTIRDICSPEVPVRFALGNHDVTYSKYLDSNVTTYNNGDGKYFSKTINGDIFVFLSCTSSSVGANIFSIEELIWFEDLLETNRNKRVFAYFHIPPHYLRCNGFSNPNGIYAYDIYGNGSSIKQDRLYFESILARYKNLHIFFGHTHMAYYMQESNTNCNYYRWNGTGARMYHVSSCSVPRDDSLNNQRTELEGKSEGYVVDVYPNTILVRGREFADNFYVGLAQYIVDTTPETIAARTVPIVPRVDSFDAVKTKTTYTIGETFNTDDITATVTWVGGTTEDVTSQIIVNSSKINITTAGTYRLDIDFKYPGNTHNWKYIYITVVDTPRTLSSITAVVNNTTVEQGQTYVPNATVTAHYDNGTTADVTSSATFSTVDTATTGEKTLTISYTENSVTKTTTATITVTEPVAPTLSSITATKTTVSYEVGDTVDYSDIVVTAHYSNGTTSNVTSSATIGTVDTSTAGSKTLNISYLTQTTTLTITVAEAQSGETIEISGYEFELVDTLPDTFDMSDDVYNGLKVDSSTFEFVPNQSQYGLSKKAYLLSKNDKITFTNKTEEFTMKLLEIDENGNILLMSQPVLEKEYGVGIYVVYSNNAYAIIPRMNGNGFNAVGTSTYVDELTIESGDNLPNYLDTLALANHRYNPTTGMGSKTGSYLSYTPITAGTTYGTDNVKPEYIGYCTAEFLKNKTAEVVTFPYTAEADGWLVYMQDATSIVQMLIYEIGGETDPVLSSISATKTKTSYYTDESFSTSDVTVTAMYSDGTTANVTSSASIGTVDITTAGTKNLSVSYTEDGITKTASVSITVSERGGSDVEIPYTIAWGTKIDSSTGAESTDSKYGASDYIPIVSGNTYTFSLDTTSSSITENAPSCKIAFYNGTSASEFISCSNHEVVRGSSLPSGTITFPSNATHFRIRAYVALPEYQDVIDNGTLIRSSGGEPTQKTLTSISATKTKTSYDVGETFSNADVVVTAHYSDSTTAIVTSSATIGTVDTSTSGTKSLSISYTEDGITKTTAITIIVTAPTPVEPASVPLTANRQKKMNYVVGETVTSSDDASYFYCVANEDIESGKTYTLSFVPAVSAAYTDGNAYLVFADNNNVITQVSAKVDQSSGDATLTATSADVHLYVRGYDKHNSQSTYFPVAKAEQPAPPALWTWIDGMKLDSSTGAEVPNQSGYGASTVFDWTGGNTATFTVKEGIGSGTVAVYCYDTNGNFLGSAVSRSGKGAKTANFPEGTVKLRMRGGSISEVPLSYFTPENITLT